MNIYKHFNYIPVSIWEKIQNGFKNENFELHYLIIPPKNNSSNFKKRKYEKLIVQVKNSKKLQNKLLEKYLEFMYQMPEVDLILNKKYAELKLNYLKYNLNLEENKFRNLKGWSDKKNNKYPVRKIFNEYLTILDNSYTDFELKFNYIIENYREEWERIFNKKIPKFLDDKFNDGFGFFLWEEYLFEIATYDIDLRLIMATQRFHEIFIKQKIIKVPSLIEINKRLDKEFKNNNQYDKWFAVQFDFFDMKKMKFRAKKSQSITSELIYLSKILEQNIDTEKITMGQLYNDYKKAAEKIIEANNPKK